MIQTTPAQEHAPGINIGEIILHHTSDEYAIGMEPFWKITWEKWPDVHLGGFAINFTPTKHLIFMILSAALVLVIMAVTKRGLDKQRADRRAPRGFSGLIEQIVLWLRDDVAIANIGEGGAKFAPLVVGLFFFILVMNVLGLLPWGATATGNLAVTAALAIMVFLIIEVGGFIKLGPKGYLGTIFPHIEGVEGVGGAVLTVAMAPIEILSKLVKPVALAIRLFGNMTAGHFVVLSLSGIILFFGSWLIGIPTALLVAAILLLETLVAGLQAYVFALLTATFIGLMRKAH
jgi:F-type H+-transporting ATPase subunit a